MSYTRLHKHWGGLQQKKTEKVAGHLMGNGAGGRPSLHLWGRNNTSHHSGHREAITEAVIRPSTCPCVSVTLSVPIMLNPSSFVIFLESLRTMTMTMFVCSHACALVRWHSENIKSDTVLTHTLFSYHSVSSVLMTSGHLIWCRDLGILQRNWRVTLRMHIWKHKLGINPIFSPCPLHLALHLCFSHSLLVVGGPDTDKGVRVQCYGWIAFEEKIFQGHASNEGLWEISQNAFWTYGSSD